MIESIPSIFQCHRRRHCLENQCLLPPWSSREHIILWNPGLAPAWRVRNTRSLFVAQLWGFHPGIRDGKEATPPKNSSPTCRNSRAHPVLWVHSQLCLGKGETNLSLGGDGEQQNIPDPTWNSPGLALSRMMEAPGPELLCSLMLGAAPGSIIPKEVRNYSQPWDNAFPEQAVAIHKGRSHYPDICSPWEARSHPEDGKYLPRSDGFRE